MHSHVWGKGFFPVIYIMELAYGTQNTVAPVQFLTVAIPVLLGLLSRYCTCVTRAVPLLSNVLALFRFLLQRTRRQTNQLTYTCQLLPLTRSPQIEYTYSLQARAKRLGRDVYVLKHPMVTGIYVQRFRTEVEVQYKPASPDPQRSELLLYM